MTARRTILVVDDEPRMRELIRLYLQPHFQVHEAEDGVAALRFLAETEPALILLDVMMPNLDGWETLRRIREDHPVPVIMLTARSGVPDRVQGLRAGADDYMAKPFDGRELTARIEAVLRRTASLTEGQTVIRRASLVINTGDRTATWAGRSLILTPKEFDLLTVLAAHPGHAWSRERLLDRVWGPDFIGETRTVDAHVKNLREELGEGAHIIATVWGIGYRFAGEEHAKASETKDDAR